MLLHCFSTQLAIIYVEKGYILFNATIYPMESIWQQHTHAHTQFIVSHLFELSPNVIRITYLNWSRSGANKRYTLELYTE